MEEYLLTENAVKEYLSFANDVSSLLAEKGVTGSDIPDEEFREVGDGTLECFLMVKGQRISFFFEAGAWAKA